MFVELLGHKPEPPISPHHWLTTRAANSWLSLSYLIFSCCQLSLYEFPKHTTALHYKYDMQIYCTFVLFVNQHFPGLPASGTHCIWSVFLTNLFYRLYESRGHSPTRLATWVALVGNTGPYFFRYKISTRFLMYSYSHILFLFYSISLSLRILYILIISFQTPFHPSSRLSWQH
jgi:hypothetical protein